MALKANENTRSASRWGNPGSRSATVAGADGTGPAATADDVGPSLGAQAAAASAATTNAVRLIR
ncbi:hypothetical protein GCM10009099_19600 [Caenispirillum bisanense]